MNFILAKKSGMFCLIIEGSIVHKGWTLTVWRFDWDFSEGCPPFRSLDGMTFSVISDKEALGMLQEYADDSVNGRCVARFIENYKALPF